VNSTQLQSNIEQMVKELNTATSQETNNIKAELESKINKLSEDTTTAITGFDTRESS
jgi:predicted secreted Zn-dependent protease